MQEWHRGGVDQYGTLLKSLESSRLTTVLTQDFGKGIRNMRIQRLMGILGNTGMATPENIPSKPNRLMFACTRYQFFLDAPFEICNKCCNVMKKSPNAAYTRKTGRHPITGQMASESRLRTQVWLKQGCNAYDAKKPISNPMAFWDESDVLLYIRLYGDNMIEDRKKAYEEARPELSEEELAEIYSGKEWSSAMCSLYGDIINDAEVDGQLNMADLGWFDMGRPCLKTSGFYRTGCVTCGFGLHLDKPQDDNRFFKMERLTNPKIVDWLLRGGRFDPEDGLWKPYQGMGYWFVLMWCNKYGNMNYRFPRMEYYFKKYSTPETDKWLK